MYFKKITSLMIVACCLAAFVSSSQAYALDFGQDQGDLQEAPLVRRIRSPEGGSVSIEASKGPGGREANVQYNHNLYTSKDGRGSIDAYANANRNFDYNRNNFGGGIQGSWRF